MKSINFVVLGDQSIASEFGKKGTSTDITLYDRKESDIIRTWVIPNGFPDKIQSLFYAINLAEYVIFYVSSLDRFTGEQIIALDSLKKHEGILSHAYDVDENRLRAMIKGTVLEHYKFVNSSNIKNETNRFESISNSGNTEIVIDHCFDVKGVGTVVLGKVLCGIVKQYDSLKLIPKNIDVVIKSIQMHDEPVTEAVSNARVGLSLKGVKSEDIERGDILCSDANSFEISTDIELDFTKNPFYKSEISENQMCLVNSGMQIKAAKFSSIEPIKLHFEKPIIVTSAPCVILKPDSETIRILGHGRALI